MHKPLFGLKDLMVLGLHPVLIDIAEYVKETGGLSVINTLFDPEDPGAPPVRPIRGLGLRCRGPLLAAQIALEVNERWTYNPEQPGEMVASFQNSERGLWVRLQVHDNTRRR